MIPKITKILIATGNKGKLVEISQLLKQLNIKTIPATNFDLPEPEETGSTFEENSILKAKYYGKQTNLISLADDSGLCIDLLNGKPGIHSARWAINKQNNQKDFTLAFNKIKQELHRNKIDLNNQIITAHFICNLTLYFPATNKSKSFQGRIDGKISFPPKGTNGFGYDPIFTANNFDKTFGEIKPQNKDRISHRNNAFEKLKDFLCHLPF